MPATPLRLPGSRFLASGARHGAIPTLALAIGILGGALAAAAQTKQYTATAVVQVLSPSITIASAGSGSASPGSAALNLVTEAQLVTSQAVATAAQQSLRSAETTAKLATDVTVTVPPNSTILDISFTAPTPAAAQTGALAFARAYLANRGAAQHADLTLVAASITAQTTALQARLTQTTATIVASPAAAAARAAALSQQGLLIHQISSLDGELAPIQSAAVNPGSIITMPTRPTAASAPSVPLDVGGGAVVGLLLGIVGAGARAKLRRKVHGPASVERVLGVPVLATFPMPGAPGSAAMDALLSPTTAAGNALGGLSNVLMAAGGAPVVLLSAVDAGDAGDGVAAGLAAAFHRHQGRAVLVLGAGAVPGSEIVRGRLADREGLEVVPLARADGRSRRVEDVVGPLRAGGRPIVVAAPTVAEGVTAQGLATSVRSVLLIVRDRSTRLSRARAATNEFTQVGATVVGVVLITGSGRSRPSHRGR